ncbi:MAG: hypothetical protein JWM59_2388 [Verrucomicrobiales bacterium]|nr:hypothetical protein [Verrucomicrobiales bacterium]
MKSITATLALNGHHVSGALAGMISGRPCRRLWPANQLRPN